jgi:hypothetical protein
MSDDTMDWIYLVHWEKFMKTLRKFLVLNEIRNLLTINGIIASPKGSFPWNYCAQELSKLSGISAGCTS